MVKANNIVTKNKQQQDNIDELFDEFDGFNHGDAVDFMHGANEFIRSGIELTKVIVEAEQKQGIKLNRQSILDIYTQSVETVAASVAVVAEEC